MDALAAIGVAIIGWGLSELSHRFRADAQRRAALGRVLVELLEVHHTAKTMALIFTQIRVQYGIPAADLVRGVDLLERIIPPDPQLSERYNAAVSEIAATHPYLAFRLKGKEQLPRILANMRSISTPGEFAILNEFLNPLNLKATEEIMRSVAWAHGFSSWWQTWRRIERKAELPKEFTAFMEEAKRRFSEVEGAKIPEGP